MDESVTLKFGRFGQARHAGCCRTATVPVGTRAFDVLVALAERRDRLVTKAELLDLVWPASWSRKTTCRCRSAPAQAARPARDRHHPRRGYQFTATLSGDDESPHRSSNASPPSWRPTWPVTPA
jgi:DNA-binding winged helix-turn-helix (wHTH) protein